MTKSAARERLDALRATGLLGSPAEESYDRLTRLVATSLSVPVALVSLVADDHQYFKSQRGLGEPWATLCRTPLSHSFCQYVVADNKPLRVDNAHADDVLCMNAAVHDLSVVAYLGVPVRLPSGHVIGSLCAIDSKPRRWTDDDLLILEDLAVLVETEIRLTTEIERRAGVERRLRSREHQLDQFNQDLEAQVAARTAALVKQREQAIRLAQALSLAEERERDRLAEVLHDDIQQLVFAALMKVERTARTAAPERRPPDEESVEHLLRRVLHLTRSLARDLTIPSFEDDNFEGALRWLSDQVYSLHGLQTKVVVQSPVTVSDRALLTLMVRLVRELLFNVVKHAQIDQARVVVDDDNGVLVVTVEDQGVGAAPEQLASSSNSYGLRSLRDRLTVLGGILDLDGCPGEGTRACIRLPLAQQQISTQ